MTDALTYQLDAAQTVSRLVEKIRAADIDPAPSENIYMEDLLEPQLYGEIQKRLPPREAYEILNHADARLPDGRYTRLMLDLTDATLKRLEGADRVFWTEMAQIFSSDALKDAILEKFRSRIHARFGEEIPETEAIPIFYKDFPGYFIRVHQDHPIKVATLQIYLPRDESQTHLGTCFYRKDGDGFARLKRNAFKPNSGYAFVRTDNSWHGVDPMGPDEDERNSVAITIYVKGSQYKNTLGYQKK